jgi:acetylornithine deacetylase/succinyl-diaminopimelate desuccinylase-like protein
LSVRDFVETNSDRYLEWLVDACSIPSLSGEPDSLEAMASWVENKLSAVGAQTERLHVASAPPALLGDLGAGERTVLIYDHYDVQPVDPIELWESKPFEPEVRSGRFFARGAADNKGDLVARLAGLEAYQEVHGDLPARVKFLIEGEEETGSRSFPALVSAHPERLDADGCIWEGVGIDHFGRPEFVFGAKGMAYVELMCRGLADDQHSSVAVVAPSPVWRLIEALTTLRAPDGRVLIDGFYDDAAPPTDDDLELLKAIPFEENAERERLGIKEFVGGATGPDLVRRYYFEPTCNIAGIVAGFTIPGTSKTVLPKEALVKVDMRLVPDQDPDDIVAKLRRHLDAGGFDDVEIVSYSMEHPVRSPADSLVGRASIAGAQEVFDEPPKIAPMMIGTGPMYPVVKILGLPTVSPAGVCRPDSNIHAPNENIRVDDFFKIIEYTAAWLRAFADDDGRRETTS